MHENGVVVPAEHHIVAGHCRQSDCSSAPWVPKYVPAGHGYCVPVAVPGGQK